MTKLNDKPVQVNLFGTKYEVDLMLNSYQNGRIAIQAVTTDGEPFGIMTTNLPNNTMAPDEFAVKNWSENVWVDDLVNCGLFEDTGRQIQSGFVQAPVWRLRKGT